MRYRANKKVKQDPHQKQYVPLPFGGGHNKFTLNCHNIWRRTILKMVDDNG